MDFNKKDLETLRDLGKQYMERAVLPINKERMNLWKKLNRFEMARPMVNIDQIPWEEINIKCVVEDPYWRCMEDYLRKTIYLWDNFQLDTVLEPYITVGLSIENTGYGISVKEERLATRKNGSADSHRFINQIESMSDVDKIKDMHFTLDKADSDRRFQEAKYIFDTIAPVRQSHGVTMHLGLWDRLSEYIGVENIYYGLIDNPELIHAAMNRITDSTLCAIKEINELKISNDIANTCHCSYTYNDELLPDFGEGKGSITKNSWAFGLAQVFTSVSPDVFAEFELPYITKMANEFGMIYYGCCDKLDNKLDLVKKIPNVKKVSCSPWSDRKIFAEQIGQNLIMSCKPNPAFLATDVLDEDIIRNDLTETMNLAKQNNVNLEFILKDISTTKYDPKRINKWAEIAMSVVNNY